MTGEPKTLLLVDDDDRLRERLAIALRERGLTVWSAPDPPTALRLAASTCPDLALLDLRMPGGSGLQLLAQLREACPKIEVVVLTGYGSIATAVEAMRLGAIDYLTKPTDADMVIAALNRADRSPKEPPSYDPPSLARTEWEHINRVLEDCGGNISQAARKLGMHRRTLQRKLATRAPGR